MLDHPRDLPQVSALAQDPCLAAYSARVRTEAARCAIARGRDALLSGNPLSRDALPQWAADEARRLATPSLRPAINMSGVVLHTGLGRARLATEAATAVAEVAANHSTLEFDLKAGGRGDRQAHVRESLCRLTDAEDALVVNNAAAGVVLALAALAGGKDVVLSRGEMVEIGGSFRMPDIVGESGAGLSEVGCTNKTRLSDYACAITPNTAAILLCHPSNFHLAGFVEKPPIEKVAELCRERGLWLVDDLGSGCLFDAAELGIRRQPTMGQRVASGAHVVIGSGDKLLGGPQAGLMVGSKEAIETCRNHPLARAFRVDKLTLAALSATLRLWLDGRREAIPTLRYLARPLPEVRRMATKIAKAYPGAAVVERGETEVGGGSSPGEGVPTFRAGLTTAHADALAAWLRQRTPPVVGRIERGTFWLDPRTAEPDEVRAVCRILSEVPNEYL